MDNQMILDALPEPAVIINKSGIIAAVNQAWLIAPINSGLQHEPDIGMPFGELLEDWVELADGVARVLTAEQAVHRQELIVPTEDGAFDYVVQVSPVYDGVNLSGVLVVFYNMTKQRNLERIFKSGAEQYRLIADYSNDMIKLADINGNIEYASPSHELILGYNDEAHILENIHPDDLENMEHVRQEMMRTKKSGAIEFRKRHRNGKWIWVETVCSPVLEDDGSLHHFILVTRDISDRKRLQLELERMAYFDHLTGLYNRRKLRASMETVLEESASNGCRFAILIMDMDRFKTINDTFGHDVGDLVLVEFARRLLGCAGKTDIVGRLSGDEFAVIMREVKGHEDIARFIARFQQAIAEPYKLPDVESKIYMRSSIGYSIYPADGDTVKELFKYADNALYREKRRRFKLKISSR